MKKGFILSLAFSLVLQAYSQKVNKTKIEYDKVKHDAYVMDLPYPPEAVENGLMEKMQRLGYKTKEEKGMFNKDKGFRMYKQAVIPAVSSQPHDYVFKVEGVRKKDDESKLYMIILDGGENKISGLDAAIVGGSAVFLNDMNPASEAAHLDLNIKKQENDVADSEKRQRKLEDDGSDMQKKLRKLQEDIEKNRVELEKLREELLNKRSALETLKAKRKPGN